MTSLGVTGRIELDLLLNKITRTHAELVKAAQEGDELNHARLVNVYLRLTRERLKLEKEIIQHGRTN